MSESNRVLLRLVPEVTPGTTPVDDAGWLPIRHTADTLAAVPRTTESQEILANRQTQDLINVGLDVTGNVSAEVSHASHDELWKAAFAASDWAANVLKIGTTEHTYTIEKEYADLASDNFLALKGMRCNGFNATWEYGRISTVDFTFMGTGKELPAASLVGAGSEAARATTTPFDASSGMTSLQLDAGAPGSHIRRLNLTLNNGLRPVEGMGNEAPVDMEFGEAVVTGNIQVYLNDLSNFYSKLLNNTEFALTWVTTDVDSNTFSWSLPRLKATTGSPDTPGKNQTVMLDLGFRGLYDATDLTTIQLTRSA